MPKKVIEIKKTGNCIECIHAVKDKKGEVIGCRNGTDKPCNYEEKDW